LVKVTHTLKVAGAADQTFQTESSPWGHVQRIDGQPFVLRWLAYRPQAVNLKLLALEDVADVGAALALAPQIGIPTQNQLLVDRQGQLAWTPAGPLPGRGAAPQLRQPEDGRLWSANHRHLGGAGFERLGDGGYAPAGRAARIRDALRAIDRADEAAIAALTLDTQAPMLARWQGLLLQTLDAAALQGQPQRAEYRRLLAGELKADPDAVAYTLVRGLRSAALQPFTARFEKRFGSAEAPFSFTAVSPRWDEPVFRLYAEAPPAWALPDAQGRPQPWREHLLALVDSEINRLRSAHGELAQARWSRTESVQLRHPMSAALPAVLGRWLDAPAHPIHGDTLTPRVQARSFGASERLIVAPGREEQGLFAMPGGPSGHPLSPFYLSDHADWAAGRFGPLLPGEAQHRLRLRP
jgi:penicillin amidase